MAKKKVTRLQRVARLAKMDLPAGERPGAHWGTNGGVEGKVHYLHSSIHGFNEDYRELTGRSQLASAFQSLKERVYNISQTNIEILRTVSQAARQKLFGATNLSEPVEKDPKIAILLNPTQPSDPTYIKAIQDLKTVINWHDYEDAFMAQLKKDYEQVPKIYHHPGNAEYDAFYANIGNRIGEVLQAFVDSAKSVRTEAGDLEEAVRQAQAILDQAQTTPDYFNTLVLNPSFKETIHSTPYSRLLGKAYEDLIAAALRQALSDIYSDASTQILRIGQNNKLTDVLLKGKPVTIQSQGYFPGANIDIGISAKLRRQNSFNFTTEFQFSDLTHAIEEDGGIEAIQTLSYIYDNYIALATWNTSRDSKRGMTKYKVKTGDTPKTYRSTFKRRKEGLLASNTNLGIFFKSLAQYISMLLLNLSFFGNRLDANNIPMFDRQFFKVLGDNIANNTSTPPSFIITSEHVYETWRVFKYYLDRTNAGHPILPADKLFSGALSQNEAKSRYSANELINVYRRKRELIKHGTDPSIYGRLKGSIMDFMPTGSAFDDMLKAGSRTLSTRIKLAASY